MYLITIPVGLNSLRAFFAEICSLKKFSYLVTHTKFTKVPHYHCHFCFVTSMQIRSIVGYIYRITLFTYTRIHYLHTHSHIIKEWFFNTRDVPSVVGTSHHSDKIASTQATTISHQPMQNHL